MYQNMRTFESSTDPKYANFRENSEGERAQKCNIFDLLAKILSGGRIKSANSDTPFKLMFYVTFSAQPWGIFISYWLIRVFISQCPTKFLIKFCFNSKSIILLRLVNLFFAFTKLSQLLNSLRVFALRFPHASFVNSL